MSLKQTLIDDMKQALRDHDSLKLNTIRFALSQIRNFEIDNGEQDDAGLQRLIAKEIKSMRDALADFERGGRMDIVADEKQKIAVLEAYLPSQLSDEELSAIVQQVVSESAGQNMGEVMKAALAKVQGRADGGRVSALVRQLL